MRYLKAAGLIAFVLFFSKAIRVDPSPGDNTVCTEQQIAAECQSVYPKCGTGVARCEPSGCGGKAQSYDCACPGSQECVSGACVTGPDMAMGVTAPVCGTMGSECQNGTMFYQSPTQSGCFPPGTMPPNGTTDCGSTTTHVYVQCMAGCSFCEDKGNAVPPGCHVCDSTNPCK